LWQNGEVSLSDEGPTIGRSVVLEPYVDLIHASFAGFDLWLAVCRADLVCPTVTHWNVPPIASPDRSGIENCCPDPYKAAGGEVDVRVEIDDFSNRE
jgi:hypothetical protein